MAHPATTCPTLQVPWSDLEYYYSLPPFLEGMLVHHKVTPEHFIRLPWQSTSSHLYSWVEREALWELSVVPVSTTRWSSQESNPDLLIQSPVHCSLVFHIFLNLKFNILSGPLSWLASTCYSNFLHLGSTVLNLVFYCRYCRNLYDRDYKATIGVDFEVERFRILDQEFNMQM